MPRYNKIRWRDVDEKELKRVVKNFNAKLARIEKKNPQMAKNLPKFAKEIIDEEGNKIVEFTDRVSVEQMKDLINTRADYNREINALKRFSRRGAEELVSIDNNDNNIKITKWQKTEITKRISRINRKREKMLEEIKNLPMKSGEEELGYTIGEFGMGKVEHKEFKPLNTFTKSMDYKDLNWKFRTAMKESQTEYFEARDSLMRENYIKSLEDNYRIQDIQDVIDRIKEMDLRDFKKTFYEQGYNFEWSYYQDDEEYDEYLSHIKSIWTPNKKG